ncbi:unnamed protein product [Linum tenue]|uniref:BURP domain-containing protein n=1 Tax=Linum tenue TaxID=586396 RepID=A0AAV0M4F6_9ROSI|nr:unnamed protein product [Linum tenue]
MKSNPLYILGFLTVALVASHAALPPELYWKSVLPNTPMPKAVSDLLEPDFLEDKSTAVSVGAGGVNVDTAKGKPPGGTTVNVGKGSGVNVNTGKGTRVAVGGKGGGVGVNTGKPGSRTNVGVGKGGVAVNAGKPGGRTNVGVGKGGVGVSTGKPGGRTNVGVGKGGVSVHTGKKGKRPVYVGVKPGKNPFVYSYAATADQLHGNSNTAIFFLEKDIHPGKVMNLDFTETRHVSTFLPRQVAGSIPFSSGKLPEILNQFSVEPESQEGKTMKNTIEECESPAIKGEEKYCATSLESMVDFSTSKLGRNVEAISTEVEDSEVQKKQEYEIKDGVKKLPGYRSVVCHNQKYAYAVFYCHTTQTSRAYVVPMEGADGKKVNAVAVCHTDTSGWNPKHLAFQLLKVKPGSVPVCHFLPQDHVVWVPKK